MSTHKGILNLMDHGTTTTDLRKMLDGDRKIKILTYTDLMDYDDLDEVLSPEGRAILLYETSPGVGHWVCIFRDENNKNGVQMFDSYGFKPDEELMFVPDSIKHDIYGGRKKLLQMLLDSHYAVRYSQYKLQGPSTSTCGRWCIMRLRLSHLTEGQFNKLFTGKGVNPDYLVTVASLF